MRPSPVSRRSRPHPRRASPAARRRAEALAGRIDDGEPIPEPTEAESSEREVAVPPGIAAKAALPIAFRQSGLTRVAFAESLGVDEKVVRRLLAPRHGTSPERIAKALRALGLRIAIDVRAA